MVLSLGIGTAFIGDLPANSADTPYAGRTAEQWIEQLRKGGTVRDRAEAAATLGFLARNPGVEWTRSGFSDVPVDLPAPRPPSGKRVTEIVTALIAGLSDPEESIRTKSAEALSWIGPRAKPAVPALTRLLNDSEEDPRKWAVTALGRIGPSARAAIPTLKSMLRLDGDPHRTIEVAETLREIGAGPETTIATLIELLTDEGGNQYAALELAQIGDPAVPALKRVLLGTNSTARQSAAYSLSNMAGWGKLTAERESTSLLLIELTRDSDSKLVCKAAQALGAIHAVPNQSIPALLSLLRHADKDVVSAALDSLKDFGAEAKPALPKLIEIFRNTGQGADAIREIGLDHGGADTLRTVNCGEAGAWLLVPLCEYPEAAVEFLRRNPEAANVSDYPALLRILRDRDPRYQELRTLLFGNEHLPLELIAELGNARFLPLLGQRIQRANVYERIALEACSRACGGPIERVVEISESQPGDFKPKSAWPDADEVRMHPTLRSHGDGFTTVIVTGRIIRKDGTPAVHPKLYRINDAMLLGQRMREELPFTHDPKTGRFVLATAVFAAYSLGEGDPPAPGPYQTGSCVTIIESEGCQPLRLQFYDEMPHVQITLSKSLPRSNPTK